MLHPSKAESNIYSILSGNIIDVRAVQFLNVDDSRKKFFAPKKKEILPSYTNLKEKIETGRSQIKSYFNIKDSIFKEIQVKDLISYSKFAKNIADFFLVLLVLLQKKIKILKIIINKSKK